MTFIIIFQLHAPIFSQVLFLGRKMLFKVKKWVCHSFTIYQKKNFNMGLEGSFSICRPVTLIDLSAIPFSICRPYPFLYVDHSLFYMSTVINFIDLSPPPPPPPPPQEYYIRGPFYFALEFGIVNCKVRLI